MGASVTDEIERLSRERDEARADVARFHDALNEHTLLRLGIPPARVATVLAAVRSTDTQPMTDTELLAAATRAIGGTVVLTHNPDAAPATSWAAGFSNGFRFLHRTPREAILGLLTHYRNIDAVAALLASLQRSQDLP